MLQVRSFKAYRGGKWLPWPWGDKIAPYGGTLRAPRMFGTTRGDADSFHLLVTMPAPNGAKVVQPIFAVRLADGREWCLDDGFADVGREYAEALAWGT